MIDTARILSTAKVICTAKQPSGPDHTRLGFSADSALGSHRAVVGALGLSTVMPNDAAEHFGVGQHLTLLFTDAEVD